MTKPPQVSVVMPVFNASNFVKAAVESVQDQLFADWELIAVDDGSTDDSWAILKNLAATDSRLTVIRNVSNAGPGPARSCGMARAQGRYVAFLDADDKWHHQKLSRQVEWMQREGHVFSCTAYTRHDLTTGKKTLVGVPVQANRRQLLLTNTVGCSTVIYDRDWFGPQQMPSLKRRQDFAFWLHLLEKTPFVAGLPISLTTYSQRQASVSSSKLAAAQDTWTMYRRHIGLSAPFAAYCFFNYALRGLMRHKAPDLARALGWLHDARTLEDIERYA